MRVLLDTNVLVSAVLFGGLPRRILEGVARGEFELVTGVELLDELEGVLVERFGFQRGAARLIRAEIEAVAELAVPTALPAASLDLDDDVVLATATAGAVAVIVTGDKDLLVLESHADIPIRTPREFHDRP